MRDAGPHAVAEQRDGTRFPGHQPSGDLLGEDAHLGYARLPYAILAAGILYADDLDVHAEESRRGAEEARRPASMRAADQHGPGTGGLPERSEPGTGHGWAARTMAASCALGSGRGRSCPSSSGGPSSDAMSCHIGQGARSRTAPIAGPPRSPAPQPVAVLSALRPSYDTLF